MGPGRIRRATRTVGAAERALGLMCKRAAGHVAFGGPPASRGVVRKRIARARGACEGSGGAARVFGGPDGARARAVARQELRPYLS